MQNSAVVKSSIDSEFEKVYHALELTKNELECMIDKEDDRIDKVFNRIASTKNDLRKLQTKVNEMNDRVIDIENEAIQQRIHCEAFEAKQKDHLNKLYNQTSNLTIVVISWGGCLTIALMAVILRVCGVI